MFAIEPPATRADLNWRLLGFPIRVSPWFWLGTVLLGWQAAKDFDLLLVWVACVFVSVIVHELGHALTARVFGARDGRIVLHGFGGLAINTGGLKRWQRIVELLCGPGAGFLLAGVAWVLQRHVLDLSTMSDLAVFALIALQMIGVIWGILNLVPVFPLDGGQIAHELFLWRRPNDGFLLSMKFAVAAAAVACLGSIALFAAGWSTGFTAFLFLLLGIQNYMILRALRMGMGAEIGGMDARPREAWERDPDWWKGS
jgi:stage IV sporulation protein FB